MYFFLHHCWFGNAWVSQKTTLKACAWMSGTLWFEIRTERFLIEGIVNKRSTQNLTHLSWKLCIWLISPIFSGNIYSMSVIYLVDYVPCEPAVVLHKAGIHFCAYRLTGQLTNSPLLSLIFSTNSPIVGQSCEKEARPSIVVQYCASRMHTHTAQKPRSRPHTRLFTPYVGNYNGNYHMLWLYIPIFYK
jgi:hypothetical protein